MLAITRIVPSWLRQGTLNRPATLQAEQKRGSVYTKLFRPCTDALSLPIPGEHSVVPAIASVFFCSNPSDVPRLVVPISINPIQLVTFAWMISNFCANFFRKHFVLSPSRVHCDSPAPVEREGIVLRVVAAPSCAMPSSVQRRLALAMVSVDPSSASVHEYIGGLLA